MACLNSKPKIYNNKHIISEIGELVEPHTMQDRLSASSKGEHADFHALRHTFATRAVESGVDIKTLSELLGHADVSTTLNRYAHSLDEQKRKAMALIAGL